MNVRSAGRFLCAAVVAATTLMPLTPAAARPLGSESLWADDWARSVWANAAQGRESALLDLLRKPQATAEGEPADLTRSVSLLESNITGREQKRTEECRDAFHANRFSFRGHTPWSRRSGPDRDGRSPIRGRRACGCDSPKATPRDRA